MFCLNVTSLVEDLRALGFTNVTPRGNSPKVFDSYSWELGKLCLEKQEAKELLQFDLAFLDGSHTFFHDAPATALLKEMIRPGGTLLFDDYLWTLEGSPTMNPRVYPKTSERYTDEQVRTAQVRIVCDLFMNRDPRFQKIDIGYSSGKGEVRRAYKWLH